MSDPIIRDEGLAGERTDLAWGRTGLSMVAILGTLLRTALQTAGLVQAIAFGVALGGAALWAVALQHARRLAGTTWSGRAAAESHALSAMTAGTVVIAAAGAMLAVFPGGGR